MLDRKNTLTIPAKVKLAESSGYAGGWSLAILARARGRREDLRAGQFAARLLFDQ
jgi:hypothetical protein